MMNGIGIRRVCSQQSILSVLSEMAGYFFDQTYNNKDHLACLSEKYTRNADFYVIEIDGAIAGYTAFYGNDTEHHAGYLSTIVVKTSYQGLGLGSLLLDTAITACKMKGMTSIRLEVNIRNEKARLFYENKGFLPLQPQKKDTILLWKSL